MYAVIAALFHKERVLSKESTIRSLQGFVEGSTVKLRIQGFIVLHALSIR